VVGRSGGIPPCGLPVIRRCSGGGAVLIGPGCLNYALIVPYDWDPRLLSVRTSMCLLLGRLARALGLEIRGDSDLALGDRKVSGNAQRRGRNALLLHGTILYDFDLPLIARHLPEPARQPAWRRGRTHSQFLANAGMSRSEIELKIDLQCKLEDPHRGTNATDLADARCVRDY